MKKLNICEKNKKKRKKHYKTKKKKKNFSSLGPKSMETETINYYYNKFGLQ